MKCLQIFLFFLFFSPHIIAQHELRITGKINGFEDGDKVIISTKYPFNTFFSYPEIEDSSVIKNGKFNLSIKISFAEFYLLTINKRKGKTITNRVFLEPSKTTILFKDSTLNSMLITGNKTANEWATFKNKLMEVKPPKLYTKLFEEYDSTRSEHPAQAAKILNKIDSILKIINEKNAVISNDWIRNHPSSFLNSYIIYSFLMTSFDNHSLKKTFYRLPLATRKNSWGKELKYIVDSTLVGDKAPFFAQTDADGNNVSLSDLIGKKNYILFDFWASWCGPCRKNNPALRALYRDFKNKGFGIMGISLDQSKQQWQEAIKIDSLSWVQLSDLEFWKNKVAQSYYIRSIPSNFLLDPGGKIIAKNLSMRNLRQMLADLLK